MKRFLKLLLGLAIIGIGVGVFAVLVYSKKEPERRPAPDPSIMVSLARVEPADEPVTVRVMGTTVAARQVAVLPEVGGRAVWVSPDLVPGGRVTAGQTLIRIDPRDYDLAIEQQRAAVGKAQMDLATERARKSVAEREWALIADELQPSEEGRRLALREIQIETAETAVDSARSSLNKARLSRSRATIEAPWNALVIDKSVDLGQVVGPSTRLATLVDSEVFWVQVTVPVESLGWIALPDATGGKGAAALVIQRAGQGAETRRAGRVIRLLGDLDPVGKMARLLVEVVDPLGGAGGAGGSLPLLLGAHVSVEIEGPRVEGAVAIPRVALRDGNAVWLAREGKLAVVPVTVAWSTEDRVFVHGGLVAGESVVVSRIAAPVAGMALRTNGDRAGADAGTDAGARP
jgi:RND family efflux transporter MFP subunit